MTDATSDQRATVRARDERVAIVTGAAGGIGGAVVDRLLDHGSKVVAVDRDQVVLRSRFHSRSDEQLLCVATDVTDDDAAERYVEAALSRFGKVDFFVNNAAIFGPLQELVELTVEDFDRVMNVNLRAAFCGLQAVLRPMITQQRGAIVNVASVGALRPARRCAAYSASKTALIMLSNIAALENGVHNIRVNAVCPGQTDTPMLQESTEGRAQLNAENHPLGRIAQPSEVASLIAYLLSDDASFQTGGVYSVDGGLRLT